MTKERIEYDADKKIVKVYRTFSSPKTLVPTKELKRWTAVAKAGEDDQGRPVKAVRYVFDNEETAKYNHQPVSYAGLQAYLKEGGKESPLGEGPDFSAREDFGIDG